MKHVTKSLLAVVVACITTQLAARDLLSPMPFRNGFHRFEHYPQICYDYENCWEYDVYGGAYHRQADKAFTDKHGTKKQSLAGLFFCKDVFTGIETFAPAAADNQGVSSLTWAQLDPRFDYSENGAMFAFNVNRNLCCGKWTVGMRANIPFRAAKFDLDCCDFEESIDDVCRRKDEVAVDEDGVARNIENAYAYRLDFVSALNQTVNNIGGNPEKVLIYRDPNKNNAVTLDEIRLDKGNPNGNPPAPSSWPVNLVAVEVGKLPEPPCTRRQQYNSGPVDPTAVEDLPVLPNDGSLAIGDRAKFGLPDAAPNGDNSNYTALAQDVAAQRRLWIQPTALTQNNEFNLTAESAAVGTAIANAIKNTNPSTIAFLENNGIVFDTQRITGAGDLDVDFFFRRNWLCGCRGDWYLEGIVGVRFPTGKKDKDPGKVLFQPLGNNRHFEVKLGSQVGWMPNCWFGLKADWTYYHVFKRTEKVAAAFQGATVSNIGPTVDARVSWDYFLFNLDLTFLHPCSECCIGFDIGYQPYVKLKDRISFKDDTATDLLGNVRPLDASVLEKNTDRIGHRIKTEMFHKSCLWEVYAGWLHNVAGKNLVRETDWYVGFGVFF